MTRVYSLYEAKAKLSAIVRQVREGHTVTVTLHGEPVAEIVPAKMARKGIKARIDELEKRGVLAPPEHPSAFEAYRGVKRSGVLKQFLKERD